MYPKVVTETANIIAESIKDDLKVDFPFSDVVYNQVSIDIISETLLPKFIKGEGMDFTDHEFKSMSISIIGKCVIEELRLKGLVDTYWDPSMGDLSKEMCFLTSKGKEETKKLVKNEQ